MAVSAGENVVKGTPLWAIADPGDDKVLPPTQTPPCGTGRYRCCPMVSGALFLVGDVWGRGAPEIFLTGGPLWVYICPQGKQSTPPPLLLPPVILVDPTAAPY